MRCVNQVELLSPDAGTIISRQESQHVGTRYITSTSREQSVDLGEYTLLERIGAGGMGQVFKAVQQGTAQVVAIKMLPAGEQHQVAVARFEREVAVATKLVHPNIIAARHADQFAGHRFLVMDFVEGQDLSALVKDNGPLSVAQAINFIRQAARGLEFAHQVGVVHRDIKPANLLLDDQGVVKILDLGLARIDSADEVAAQAELTETGTVMGTVDYMAPEQALCAKNADARADIYSLGCTLFYLLTGRPLFEGTSLTARLISHQTKPIPNLCEQCPEIAAELAAIFNKMVAKQVADRYQSMGEVIADLERLALSPADEIETTNVTRSNRIRTTESATYSLQSASTVATYRFDHDAELKRIARLAEQHFVCSKYRPDKDLRRRHRIPWNSL